MRFALRLTIRTLLSPFGLGAGSRLRTHARPHSLTYNQKGHRQMPVTLLVEIMRCRLRRACSLPQGQGVAQRTHVSSHSLISKTKRPLPSAEVFWLFGGDNEIRTHDLCSAIAALSQLSYIPTRFQKDTQIRKRGIELTRLPFRFKNQLLGVDLTCVVAVQGRSDQRQP